MLRYILLPLFILFFNLNALEISINGAQQDYKPYSTLHIKDKKAFLCQEIKDELGNTNTVVCAFSQQPSQKFRNLQNDFFTLTSSKKDKTFFVVIKSFYKMKLFAIDFNLASDESIFGADIKLSKHWMVVGYKDKIPYITDEKQSDTSINFPFVLKDETLPYVGGLDMKGNPVYIKKVQDVSDYLKIKRYFGEKKYDLAIELIDEVLQNYPNTLFKGEFLYFKIKAQMELKHYDDAIEIAKIYLREFSSDENIAEVLSLDAKAYAKIGMNVDADYFFDRLFSEHSQSVYAQWGYIYKGEMLESSGASKKALQLYQKALMQTKDIDVAASAAYKLAQYYASNGHYKKAAKYIDKILKAKGSFLYTKIKTSFDMAYSFADVSDYQTAAMMAKALLKEMSVDDDNYEVLLKDEGVWLSKTPHKKEALKVLNKYLSTYKYGNFEDEIKIAKDSLFFDMDDENLTSKLKHYDELINEYKDDTIGAKALYEKAKVMLKNKMYADILKLKSSLENLDKTKYKDVDNIIKDAAVGEMKEALKLNECREVLYISANYKITLSAKWDDGIYRCSMKGADFLLAKKIASKHLKAKELQERKKWLYRYIKIDFATGNYSDVLEASKELLVLIDGDKNSPYLDIYRILFDTYQRLEKNTKMVDAISKIQDIYGVSYKDIDRYVAVINIGSELKDDNLVIKYASEVVNIQKKSSSYAQSPFVEFALYQAYINKGDNNKALKIIKSLDSLKLTKDQRARQKYLLGSVYSKLWQEDNAQKAYDEAIKAKPSSAWAKLAKDAKTL